MRGEGESVGEGGEGESVGEGVWEREAREGGER